MADPVNLLGTYLRDRRTRLDPAAFGVPAGRRRTPGLRREEVAQRANISPAWYTWLEQGRGGAPSADVLDRLARALMLTEMEREHLFLLGLGRPPALRYRRNDGVTPRLQRILDKLEPSPAFIRTATWDVLAWNRAASAVLMTDYAALPPGERNVLRLIFLDPRMRAAHDDWQSVARYIVSAFRIDAARAGAASEITPLVDELSRLSPEFAALWQENEVEAWCEATKFVHHPLLGDLELESSLFAIDGRPELNLVVLNPITAEDAAKIAALVERTADIESASAAVAQST